MEAGFLFSWNQSGGFHKFMEKSCCGDWHTATSFDLYTVGHLWPSYLCADPTWHSCSTPCGVWRVGGCCWAMLSCLWAQVQGMTCIVCISHTTTMLTILIVLTLNLVHFPRITADTQCPCSNSSLCSPVIPKHQDGIPEVRVISLLKLTHFDWGLVLLL